MLGHQCKSDNRYNEMLIRMWTKELTSRDMFWINKRCIEGGGGSVEQSSKFDDIDVIYAQPINQECGSNSSDSCCDEDPVHMFYITLYNVKTAHHGKQTSIVATIIEHLDRIQDARGSMLKGDGNDKYGFTDRLFRMGDEVNAAPARCLVSFDMAHQLVSQGRTHFVFLPRV